MEYVETDCTVEFDGRKFSAGGAVVSSERIIAYLAKDGVLTDWHGKPLGTYRITSTWRTPRSYVSSTMSQVLAIVDGIAYTGRSAGVGMAYVGRRKRAPL
jgi:hypothetical protein